MDNRYMNIVMPTQLSDERVEKFRALYKEHFHEELSFAEAYDQGLQLIQFMATILQLSGAYFPADKD